MLLGCYGVVAWQYGVGVCQPFEIFVETGAPLFLRTVLGAEEAGAFGDAYLVYACSRRDDACGVALYAKWYGELG